MAYQVLIKPKVVKALEKINEPHYTAIKTTLFDLADNPRPNGCKKLKGRDGWRIRVGDYRIIYTITDKILTVEVVHIGHRKDVYD
ncbi:MAG: type II toxin-antitoxin system RelE/ParE family toxin [Chitinophagaceae bacterium]|nr:type II toxin-antitoxin system RelE/ParE family toxin [Chitinophagaceae bacterium]